MWSPPARTCAAPAPRSTPDRTGHLTEPEPEVLQDRADRPVVRIGDVVRHPRQPWSEAVHALLGFLQEAGFPEAPAPGSIEGAYDDVGFIPGIAGDEACLQVGSDDAVAQVGAVLRHYHDTVIGWQAETPPLWFDGQFGTGDGRELLVCHGDVGPWNFVWRDGRLVGLIDWENATVGTRRSDVAYALHYLAPFRDRSYWQGVLGMAEKPRRRHRMRVFAEAYGIAVDEQLVRDVLAAQRAGVDLMVTMAHRGDPRRQQLIMDGELDRERRAVAWSRRRRRKFLPRQARHGQPSGSG